MELRSVLSCNVIALGTVAGLVGAAPAAAQQADSFASAPQQVDSFTSAAQAREYLAQNPTGARAEAAFRTIVAADLVARYPSLLSAEAPQDIALQIMPGSIATPLDIESAISLTAPAIGALQAVR